MFCASVAYPTGLARFDFEYFRDRHATMFARLLGSNCVRYEVHRGLATEGAPPPPFSAAAYFWLVSPQQFGETLATHGEEIYRDIAAFTDGQPVRGWAAVEEAPSTR
jgi:uncharacterized protein (TIGR02118 family)